ncbi:MAG: S8/S53 family peptidase [Aggregatilineales bacterium]
MRLRTPQFRKHRLTLLVMLITGVLLSMSIFPVAADDTPSTGIACAVTTEMVTGQGGYALSGLGGYALSGLGGYALSGLGSGGYALSGLGDLTPQETAALIAEIEGNPATPEWLSTYVRNANLTGGDGFNSVKVGLLIVDDFDGTTDHLEHGELVNLVVDDLTEQLLSALGITLNIEVIQVDISEMGNYQIDAISAGIQSAIDGRPDIEHWVINMSFGLVPCEFTDDEGNTFNFNDFIEAREDSFVDSVRPVLECIVYDDDYEDEYEGYSGEYEVSGTAYFGYQNDNDQIVTIPTGNNNKLTPSQEGVELPTTFYPGRIINAFSVPFYGSDIVWTLEGPDGSRRTSTAGLLSPECNHPPRGQVIPIIECVATDGEVKVARFGYLNQNPFVVEIPIGNNNKFSPLPKGRGQHTVFQPGRVEDAFSVTYTGQLNWHLRYGRNNVTGSTATADPCTDLPGGPDFNDFNLIDYLEGTGVTLDEIFGGLDPDQFEDLTDLLDLLIAGGNVIPVASSGNFAPTLGSFPLVPASLPQVIAVCATLGDDGPQWTGSHDGNMCAPGGWYEFQPGYVGIGTSWSAPFVSVIAAIWLTYPDACTFQTDGEGNIVGPPITIPFAEDFVNAIFTSDGLNPLNCSFDDDEPGSLTIVKETSPANTRRFNFDGGEELGTFRLRNGESETFEELAEGSYTVAETNTNSNWLLEDVTCTVDDEGYDSTFEFNSDSNSITVDLAEGENVTCTFYNVRSGRITAKKYEDLNGNGHRNAGQGESWLYRWEMTVYQGESEVASGDTGESGYVRFDGLLPGEYTVCEEDREGWENTSHEGELCTDVVVTSAGNATVVFGNRETFEAGSITINKEVISPNDGDFNFRSSQIGNFTLSDGESYTAEELEPGTYTIRETNTNNNNWYLDSVICGEGVEYNVNLTTATLTIYLGAGEDANCTFYNERASRITATKFNDLNINGRFNGGQGEERLSEWGMLLYEDGELIAESETNSNGVVQFRGLHSGTYVVCEVQQLNWRSTTHYVDEEFGQPCSDPITLVQGNNTRVDFGNIYVAPPVSGDCDAAFAYSVYSFDQSDRKDGNPVNANRSITSNALGAPDSFDAYFNFYSLGFGGTIILEFNTYIVQNPYGHELTIYETSFGGTTFGSYPEQARVWVAQSASGPWFDLGVAQHDEYLSFPPELDWARYVKIRDISNPDSFGNDADGYDVDAVGACMVSNEAPGGGEEVPAGPAFTAPPTGDTPPTDDGSDDTPGDLSGTS